MVFAIILILIVSLVVMAILVNAVQQHNEKVESEKRAEITKLKSIIDDTEVAIMSTEQIPVTQRLIYVLQCRIYNALRATLQLNPDATDVRSRLKNTEQAINQIRLDKPPPADDAFKLPSGDKEVIQLIRGIKNMRQLLLAEHRKGKVESSIFVSEDKILERLQLRANVDTLMRRGEASMKANQMGSARQCLEKAIGALASQSNPDNYITTRKAQLESQLSKIQEQLRSSNTEDVAKKRESERNELDELFADKKKW
jgi:hypothetical protein